MTGRRHGTLVVLCSAQFMVVLDSSIVAVALPSMSDGLRASPAATAWVVTAYTVTSGSVLLLAGRAADVVGARRCLVRGLGIFSTASLLGGVAPDVGLLVAARIGQGAGAALISPAALALIIATHTRPDERTRALGIYGAVLSTGFVAGTILGGVLTDVFGWRSVMFVNVPVGVLALLLVHRLIEEVQPRGGVHAHPLGTLIAGAAAGTALAGFAAAPERGWTSPITLALLTASATMALAPSPRRTLLPPALRAGPLLPAAAAAFLVVGAGNAMLFLLTYHMQQRLHFTPMQTGGALCGLGLTSALAGAMAPRAAARFGLPRTLLAALAIQTATLLSLSGSAGTDAVPLLIVGTAAFGLGHLAAVVILTRIGTAGARKGEEGIAGAVLLTAQQAGAGLILGLVAAIASTQASLTAGFRTGLATAAIVTVCAVGLSLTALRRLPVVERVTSHVT